MSVLRPRALSTASTMTSKVVVLTYEDLLARKDLTNDIKEAYGKDGLGILTVSGVPGYVEKRRALLPLAQKLANLSDAKKAALEHAASTYSFGWSHGKEKFNGMPDV